MVHLGSSHVKCIILIVCIHVFSDQCLQWHPQKGPQNMKWMTRLFSTDDHRQSRKFRKDRLQLPSITLPVYQLGSIERASGAPEVVQSSTPVINTYLSLPLLIAMQPSSTKSGRRKRRPRARGYGRTVPTYSTRLQGKRCCFL